LHYRKISCNINIPIAVKVNTVNSNFWAVFSAWLYDKGLAVSDAIRLKHSIFWVEPAKLDYSAHFWLQGLSLPVRRNFSKSARILSFSSMRLASLRASLITETIKAIAATTKQAAAISLVIWLAP
jgi:hypothetical protein